MRTAAATLLCLFSAAWLAGCGDKANWDWFKKKEEPAPAPVVEDPSSDPNLGPLTTEQATALREELAAQRAEVERLKARDRAMSEQLRELQELTRGQEKQIQVLADAPNQRDLYKAMVEELKAQNARLIDEIRVLKGGAPTTLPSESPRPATRGASPSPATQPFPQPSSQPASAVADG